VLSEKIHTRSASETKDYAKNLAKKLDIGTVVALIGNLGSGKTTFAQGFAEGLNIFKSIDLDDLKNNKFINDDSLVA